MSALKNSKQTDNSHTSSSSSSSSSLVSLYLHGTPINRGVASCPAIVEGRHCLWSPALFFWSGFFTDTFWLVDLVLFVFNGRQLVAYRVSFQPNQPNLGLMSRYANPIKYRHLRAVCGNVPHQKRLRIGGLKTLGQIPTDKVYAYIVNNCLTFKGNHTTHCSKCRHGSAGARKNIGMGCAYCGQCFHVGCLSTKAKLRSAIVCDSCISEGRAILTNLKERNGNISGRARKRLMRDNQNISWTPDSGRSPQNEAAQRCASSCAKIAAECQKSAFEALTGIKSAINEVCDSSIGWSQAIWI